MAKVSNRCRDLFDQMRHSHKERARLTALHLADYPIRVDAFYRDAMEKLDNEEKCGLPGKGIVVYIKYRYIGRANPVLSSDEEVDLLLVKEEGN